jgi:peptidyl-prolyl cis-trans isomerase C
MNKRYLFFILLLAPFSATVFSDNREATRELGKSQAPLATQSDVVLTQAEIDAAFSKIPVEKRLPFIRMGEKVELLVRNLLRNKLLASEARKAGYERQTLVNLRMELAIENQLATEWLAKIVEDAPPADYEAIAYEKYLVEPDYWKTADEIDVSHILVSSESRSYEAADQLATTLWEELRIDPSRFDSMIEEYSEDPSKVTNGGRFSQVKPGDMVKRFEDAAFAMENPGDISSPVETKYGFHIIRLNQKNPGVVLPFDDIKESAMQQVKEKYLVDYETRYLTRLLSAPIVLPDGATEEMAKRYFGEDLELAPEFGEQ